MTDPTLSPRDVFMAWATLLALAGAALAVGIAAVGRSEFPSAPAARAGR